MSAVPGTNADPNLLVFSQKLELLKSELLAEWKIEQQGLHEPIPKQTFFHYTSVRGMKGILQSRKMWATNIHYLNDLMELSHAETILLNVVRAKVAAQRTMALEVFLERLERTSHPRADFHGYYVSCFCERDDLLSQWRGYTKLGGGYCIEFKLNDRELPSTIKNGLNSDFFLRKVIYEKEVQEKLMSSLVEKTFSLLVTFTNGFTINDASLYIGYALTFIKNYSVEYMICFKNEAFQEEQEWRLIHIGDPSNGGGSRLNYRETGSLLIPYVELAFGDERHGDFYSVYSDFVIPSIRFGPTIYPELTRRSLDMFLQKNGYHRTEIRGSDVPLRIGI
jgi:hypothetical protein